jgi:hypothetical protein
MFLFGIYADLKRLYRGNQPETIQKALIQSGATYRQRGIHPVQDHPTMIFFPTIREYDFFIADMREQGCLPVDDFIPISSALKAVINHPVTVEKTVSDGRNNLFIALRVGYFDDRLQLIDRKDTPLLIMQAVEKSIEQFVMLGVDGNAEFNAMLGGLKVEVTALELNSARFINKTLGNRFFLPFDWFFDWIDKIFASGTGDEFNMMGEALSPQIQSLVVQGVHEALLTAVTDNITIQTGDMQATIRVLIEERLNFLDGLETIGGVAVLDDVHDGTYWTFDIGLKTQTFYNNRNFADILEHTNAEIINQSIS